MPTVLIVDDKEKNRDVLVDFFRFFGRKSGIEIMQASSGEEAVNIATNSQFDLILMDINMETPYAGLDATRSIKTKFPDSKIFAITAQSMKAYDEEQSDEQKCLDAGCDMFISKPFSQKDLLIKVAESLSLTIPDRVWAMFEGEA
jgi:CheY-like chemotaxis protein